MKGRNNIYAVIDTNVLVSALLSRSGQSNPALVISAVLDGAITPLYNEELLLEYIDVLSRPKFNLKASQITDLLAAFRELGVAADRTPVSGEDFPDCDGIVFYEITMSVEDAYLVTGNIKHFPRKSFVVTPLQMVDLLRSKGLLI